MVMLDRTTEQSNNEVSSSSGSPLILRKVVHEQAAASAPSKKLRLMMLGCEDSPPYGPTDHTGQLFLELIAQCLAECSAPDESWVVTIAVYRVQMGEYPDDWDAYDGILLPGSFAAAYDTDPWIEKLKHTIQTEIVANQRKTMGICFGHQVLAHSFDSPQEGRGLAQKYPVGSRAGRYAMQLTPAGSRVFGKIDHLNLYYTHGDMVQKLPPCAVALGREGDELPVQSAAYFGSEQEAQAFAANNNPPSQPFAVTFQAHPEYGVTRELGLECTLGRIFNLMTEKELIHKEFQVQSQEDAIESFDLVHRQSKDAFVGAARALGWFP